ncbi:MAG TPA: hypothetical protein VGS11_12375 [Candidatus Bathyarchaeia archaeon]|nr:hypothetical protein [Candidatus Bathyarchaeia archaeon]
MVATLSNNENGRLKDLLADLIDSSEALDVRVWLDGVYTDIGDEQVHGDWMSDRDVYFKVEGRVDKKNGSDAKAGVDRQWSGA